MQFMITVISKIIISGKFNNCCQLFFTKQTERLGFQIFITEKLITEQTLQNNDYKTLWDYLLSGTI